MLLDGLGSFLAGLANVLGEFRSGLLAEALPRRVAVENLLALGIELRFRLGIERTERLLLAERPFALADAAVLGVLIKIGIAGIPLFLFLAGSDACSSPAFPIC